MNQNIFRGMNSIVRALRVRGLHIWITISFVCWIQYGRNMDDQSKSIPDGGASRGMKKLGENPIRLISTVSRLTSHVTIQEIDTIYCNAFMPLELTELGFTNRSYISTYKKQNRLTSFGYTNLTGTSGSTLWQKIQ